MIPVFEFTFNHDVAKWTFQKVFCNNFYVAFLAAGKLDLLFQRGNIEKLLSKEILRHLAVSDVLMYTVKMHRKWEDYPWR